MQRGKDNNTRLEEYNLIKGKTRQDKTGQDRTGQDRTGQDRKRRDG